MNDIQTTLGDRNVRGHVRDTLKRAPAFKVEDDLPRHWLDLLDELDRVLAQRDERIAR